MGSLLSHRVLIAAWIEHRVFGRDGNHGARLLADRNSEEWAAAQEVNLRIRLLPLQEGFHFGPTCPDGQVFEVGKPIPFRRCLGLQRVRRVVRGA